MTELNHRIFDCCMDVTAKGSRLFAIQRSDQYPGGRLCVLDKSGTLLGEYTGIGSARQIEIKGDIAVVSAREGGLWIFDIHANTPKLMSHYKTVEFATGVTLYAQLALISCRQYGVEVIDISDPAHPSHLRTIPTGEVQSACVHEGYLYCGIWGKMEILTIDIRNINAPQTLSHTPLQGRGDGLIARGNRLYATTGQHRRGLLNKNDPHDPCFGQGNGVELFDITDPAQPRPLARREFGYGHSLSYDMWDANLSGNYLISNCSICGVHLLNATTFKPLRQFAFDDPVTGVSAMSGSLFIATAGGLYRLDDLLPEPFYCWDSPRSVEALPEPFSADSPNLVQRYCGDFPVHGICSIPGGYALACGESIHLLNQHFELQKQIPTGGGCCQVEYCDQKLYAALSRQGLAVYDLKGLQLMHRTFETPVLQLALSASGEFLHCIAGASDVFLLRTADLSVVTSRHAAQGPLYGANFLSGQIRGANALFWHRDGLVFSNPDSGQPGYQCIFYERSKDFMSFGPERGCDTDGERIFFNHNKQLILLPLSPCNADLLPLYRTEKPLEGKLVYHREKLIAAERARGLIQVSDISDLEKIRTLHYIQTNASCEKPVILRDRIFIPGWYAGLLELKGV